MENPEMIHIWWEGPFTYDEIMQKEKSQEIQNQDNSVQKIGLYQVYGNHILYGKDVLLYIGMTTDGFQNRLKDRWIINNSNDFNRLSIYLGTIYSYDKTLTKDEIEAQIAHAEALLINVMTPAFNSSYINSVGKKFYEKKFTVYNLNSYRSLLPELSTMRYWNGIGLNYELVEKIRDEYSPNAKIENTDEYYGFDLDENIWFGVDYAYWEEKHIPLIIAVLNENELKEALDENELEINSHGDYLYIEAYPDLRDINTVKEDIRKKIEAIKEAIKK